MRLLIVFFLLAVKVAFGQMADFNRLKAAAEIAFGYEDEVYPDTFYVGALQFDPHLYIEKRFTDSLSDYPKLFVYRESDSTALNGVVIQQSFTNGNKTYMQSIRH